MKEIPLSIHECSMCSYGEFVLWKKVVSCNYQLYAQRPLMLNWQFNSLIVKQENICDNLFISVLSNAWWSKVFGACLDTRILFRKVGSI